MKQLFLILFLFFTIIIKSEVKDTVLPIYENLEEITLFAEDNTKEARIKRYRIRRRLKKVWKYAILTQDEFEKIERVLSRLHSKSIKKKYKKVTEKFIRNNFEETLKNFYIQDGQILLKMVYRQTGKSVYDITYQLKGRLSVIIWNSMAYFFEMSLKSEYHPTENKEDFLIEKYLQELFDEGILCKREPNENIYKIK